LSSPDVESSTKQHKVSHSNDLLKSDGKFTQQQGKERLSTGSKNLDDLLSGGLETGAITQFYGASNTGKTHLCHLLCVVLPSTYQAIYIDTEGGFREQKVESIATARGLDWTNILSNIQVLQPKDSKQQESHIKDACSVIKSSSNSKVKLLIVDSMMFHYIGEYPGRSGLSKRAHSLNIYMHMLHNLAQTKNVAVVITNQSTSNPRHDEFESKSPQPFGGKVISNTSTYIVNLDCRGYFASNIDARLIKSPLSSFNSRLLKIVEGGFVDVVSNYLSENGEDVASGLDE
jgi:DNA repair protein RadA